MIAEIEEAGLRVLTQDLVTTRMGEGLYVGGKLRSAAMERTLDCLSKYKRVMNQYGVEFYRVVATSAIREAENGKDFIKLLGESLELKADIIDGHEEAELSYLGVKKGLYAEGRITVIDLGGGSTEFIWEGEKGELFLHSIPLGAVRVYESGAGRPEMLKALEPLRMFEKEIKENPWVLVGGTITTLAAMSLKLAKYDTTLIHGYDITIREVGYLYELLSRLSEEERKTLPGLPAERADIIPSGSGIVHMLMGVFDKDTVTVSESGILEGMIWKMAQNGLGNRLKIK